MPSTISKDSTAGEVYISYKSRKQIAPLTSIRAIAIVWIIIYHYHFFLLPLDNYIAQQLIRYAFICLDLFFVLSGFILSYVYYDSFSNLKLIRKNSGKFLLTRFSRIYPLHCIVLFSMLLMQAIGLIPSIAGDMIVIDMLPPNEGDTMENFFLQLFMLHGLGFGNPINWNIASWSVSTEALFYVIFPLLAWCIHKIESPFINTLFIICICIMLYLHVDQRPLDYHNGIALYAWVADIPRALLNCTMGMSLALLYRKKFLAHLPWDALLGAVAILWIAAVLLDSHEGLFFGFIPFILLGLCYIKGPLYTLLSSRILVTMGEAAYSLYLWHMPFILCVMNLSTNFLLNEEDTIFLSWYTLPILLFTLVLLAISSNNAIEKPFRQKMKKFIE